MTLIRPATPADIDAIHAMIVELAVYEREPDGVRASPTDLHEALFGVKPVAEALIAQADGGSAEAGAGSGPGAIAGHAIFHTTFSTWEGKAGIWLEDLYVRPAFRGTGAGAALFRALARLTLERGYTRYEWVALDWNTPALDFYARFNATRQDQWLLHRLSGSELASAAAPGAEAQQK
jgi:GNAT superfamily N-acetyltransferase